MCYVCRILMLQILKMQGTTAAAPQIYEIHIREFPKFQFPIQKNSLKWPLSSSTSTDLPGSLQNKAYYIVSFIFYSFFRLKRLGILISEEEVRGEKRTIGNGKYGRGRDWEGREQGSIELFERNPPALDSYPTTLSLLSLQFLKIGRVTKN